jgi:hypothetical protein
MSMPGVAMSDRIASSADFVRLRSMQRACATSHTRDNSIAVGRNPHAHQSIRPSMQALTRSGH